MNRKSKLKKQIKKDRKINYLIYIDMIKKEEEWWKE